MTSIANNGDLQCSLICFILCKNLLEPLTKLMELLLLTQLRLKHFWLDLDLPFNILVEVVSGVDG